MTGREFEERLRLWYRAEVRDSEMAPLGLRNSLAAIPGATPTLLRRLGGRRVMTMLAAAAVVIALLSGPLSPNRVGGLLPPFAGVSTGAGASPNTNSLPAPTPSPSASPSPAPASKIAFFSDRDGKTEIYVMNADGSGQTNVSHGPGDFNGSPWSPDGSRIAFTSDRDGNLNVYVVNADGSGLTNVSNNPCGAFMLAWSPDGSRVAFSSGPLRFKGSNPTPTAGGCVSTIYVVNADGTGRINLTNGPADAEHGWSPDGSRFAFTSGANGKREVYVVNADGSGRINLSNSPGDDFGPAWSPDSSRVSFVSQCKVVGGKLGRYVVNADGSGLTYLGLPPYDPIGFFVGCAPTYDGPIAPEVLPGLSVIYASSAPDGTRDALQVGNGRGNLEIYVVNADRSGVTNLTNNPAEDSIPVWSPDSSRIAWNRSSNGSTEIWVMNAEGSGQARLSIGPDGDALRDGGWSPDSSRIAFVSRRDGNGEIYLVNADGSGLTNLTDNPGEDSGPVWSPVR